MYQLRCGDFEKTILDIVHRPKYVGGIHLLAQTMYGVGNRIDFTKLLDCTRQSKSQAIIKYWVICQ